MKPGRRLDVAVLVAATGLTRFAFRSHYLYDIDSVNFALGMKRFNTVVHQPHPPGYFLYVCLGRVFNTIFHDANAALVAMSIVFSCGAIGMIYALADNWFGGSAARFAGFLFLFSPLAWFHGTVALTYIVEAFFSSLIGYLCWRIYLGASAPIIFMAAAVLGIASGFRPSSILFLGPLLIFSLRNATWKHVAGAIGAIALTTIAWFIPMILTVGPEAYVSALVSLWVAVPGKVNIFNSSVMNSLARAVVIVSIFFLCFGTAAILAILRVRDDSSDNRNKRIFTSVWIAPGLLFFTFVYLKFVNSGYLLILMPPVCAWMGLWAARWYASPRVSKAFRISATGVCAAANAAIFIYCPVYCSYGAVRSFERELGVIVSVLPQIAPSEDTMIVGMDSHFLGYRHAGYYLPDYLTVQYPEVQLATGRRVFAMQNRDTRLAGGLNTSSMREFVIFPLPPGDAEYSDYMTTLRKRFPPGDIRLVTRGGLEFAIGPAQDLYLLFPVFAATINGTVYRK